MAPAFPRVFPAPARSRRRGPARPGPLADPPRSSADGARDRQPPLAASLRPGAGRHAERLRRARRAAHAPGTARLAGQRIRREGLVGQAHAAADGALERLLAGQPGRHPPSAAPDPDNRLLVATASPAARGGIVRDGALAVAGTLNREQGGPMVRVPLEPEVYELIFTEGEPDGLWPITPDPRQHVRRSLYLFAKRNVRLPLLRGVRQAGHADLVSGAASQHVRPAGADPPQRAVLAGAEQGVGRPAAARVRPRRGPADRPGLPAGSGPAPRPAERETVRAFLRTQAGLLPAP